MLQIYHFAFGIGGLLSPIVAEPFLSFHPEHAAGPLLHTHLRRSVEVVTEVIETGSNSTAPTQMMFRESRIHIPYGIISLIHFALFVSMLVFYCIDSSDSKPPPEAQKDEVTASKCKRYVLLMCLSLYLMVYVALESSLGQMLATFAVKSKLRFTKSHASYLSSVFWTTFTMSRAFSALWALMSTPKCMMFTEHAMSLFALGMFLWFGETSAIMVWVCAAMVGIGAAGMFATAITWTVSYFLSLPPISTSVLSHSAALRKSRRNNLKGPYRLNSCLCQTR